MRGIQEFARAGGLVLGICNGFQVLLEAGLLPGAMLRNASLQFRSEWVWCRVERTDTPFTSACTVGQVIRLPIAHGEGCYYADDRTLDELEAEDRIAFRYLDNPNGSLRDIAGILSRERNVMGMMPHPERASEALLGGEDGLVIWRSMIGALTPAATV